MRLIHYSKKPLVKVRSTKHSDRSCGAYKTPGLWVSVEGEFDWPAWCKSAQVGFEFTYATEVILTKDANVKLLTNANQIDALTKTFTPRDKPAWDRNLDWPAIRSEWNGLIVAPYCWARRHTPHTNWYYGWDCASGVIWNAKAVKELRAVELPKGEVANALLYST